ncbi:MAG: DEAD/DEAH box helicase, partial [Planctomycetota bacterium]
MLLPLRDYQKSAFAQVREHIRAGKKRILLVAPTGSGKTVTSSHLLHGAHLKGNSAMFLAHRREIIYQTQEKLNDAHLEHSLIMSGHRQSMMVITHLASIQTLIRREFAGLNIKILIIDEAHHAVAGTYKRIIEAYPDAIIIGLTATPCRGDGRGLGGIFDSMVVAATVPELIELGYLVPPRIFSANIPGDVRDLHIKR